MQTSKKARTGALLLNVGTPDQPEPPEVRAYLKEFLMDPYVIDIPFPMRWMLVNWGVLPKRSIASAEAYRKIWTERGSPLLFHLTDLVQKVQKELKSDWWIQGAMRYGNPSIRSAIQNFKNEGISRLLVFPLYPQYSTAATESGQQEVIKQIKLIYPEAQVQFVKPFYHHPLFIEAFKNEIGKCLQEFITEFVLFSFHGLPERQLKKLNSRQQFCFSSETCCDQVQEANWNCYRAQCFSTAQSLAQSLGLKKEQYAVGFQSRLGKTPWIRPFTDELYRTLPAKGIKRVAVACPSFVADCLETLEEVQMRGKEEFIRSGGEDLKLVVSLNSTPTWVRAVTQMLQDIETKLDDNG